MKELVIIFSDEEFNELMEKAKKAGFVLLNDYVKYQLMKSNSSIQQPQIDMSTISGRIERKIQDVLMPFTSEIDTLKMQIAMVLEKIDEISDNIHGVALTGSKMGKKEPRIQKGMKEMHEKSETPQSEKGPGKDLQQAQKEAKEKNEANQTERTTTDKKKDAMSVLKEQGVVLESELNLRNRDALFSKLEKEGAKIITTEKERIAIHPDFYAKFTSDLSKINTADVNEATKHLDEKEAKLFKKLVSEGLAYFDNGSKSWKLLV
jgi:vacuolar-type H+-ATPase subunit I/STV1